MNPKRSIRSNIAAGGGAGGHASSFNPGPGLNVSITGTSVEYARGGTGFNHPNVRQAPANSGDGGRGAYNPSGSLGGSGIVILRMATASYSGTTSGSPSVTTSGSDTILTFTGSGTYTA